MKEFTYGELMQGLICCTVYKNCADCPCYRGPDEGPEDDCTYHLMAAAMNCINVMEKDLADTVKRVNDWEEFARRMSIEK